MMMNMNTKRNSSRAIAIFIILTILIVASPVFINAIGSDEFRIDGSIDESDSKWNTNKWRVQTDGVMGGKSSGKLEFITDSSILRFNGEIVLNGGGFSSVRRNINLDLSDYSGVVVTLKSAKFVGNAAPIGIQLQFGDSSSYYGFSSAFAIPYSSTDNDNGEVVASVFLPMNSFDRATSGGYVCKSCNFDSSKIDEISVYVLFQEGKFDVRLKSIVAVKEKRSFQSPKIEFTTTKQGIDWLQNTISRGVSLYNKSYKELCIHIYWSALNTIIESKGVVPDSIKVVVCSGLKEVKNGSKNKQEQAWTLRDTIDAVIADLDGASRVNSDGVQGYLPSVSEAKTMKVTCVGRTSPSEGAMYKADSDNITCEDSESFNTKPNKSKTCKYVKKKIRTKGMKFCNKKLKPFKPSKLRIKDVCPFTCKACE